MKPFPNDVTLSSLYENLAYPKQEKDRSCPLTEVLDSLDDCWVVDVESENDVSNARSWFDTKVRSEEGGAVTRLYEIMAWFVPCGQVSSRHDNEFSGENFFFAKRLLALGLDPDVGAVNSSRPGALEDAVSHVCCKVAVLGDTGRWIYANPQPRGMCKGWAIPVRVAGILGACRPDLNLKGAAGMTPKEFCWQNLRFRMDSYSDFHLLHEIYQLWVSFRINGFPTIAELCQRKQWWAVKNLCRRRVVPDDEVYVKFVEKDAVEWALYYGQVNLARELRYLLHYQDNTGVSPLTGGHLSLVPVERVREVEEALQATKEALAAQKRRTEAFQDQVKNLEAKFAGLALVTRSTAAAMQDGEKIGDDDSKERTDGSTKSEVPGLGLMTVGLRKLFDDSFRTPVSLSFMQDLLEVVKKHRYT